MPHEVTQDVFISFSTRYSSVYFQSLSAVVFDLDISFYLGCLSWNDFVIIFENIRNRLELI